MSSTIYKYERSMLGGEPLRIHCKRDCNWAKKHWHNYYEIVYFEQCTGTCILNGERHTLAPRTLYLLTPKDFHEILPTAPPCDAYILAFSEQAVDKQLLDALNRGAVVLEKPSALLGAQIAELQRIYTEKSEFRELQMRHLFNALLAQILEKGTALSAVPHDVNPIVRESIAYMLTFPAEEITLASLSKKFGISPTYLSHLFHKSTGIPFKQYLTALRIEHAKRLLEEKDLPIIEVGFECGFNTPSQFIRMFKSTMGTTPSDYRASKSRPMQ